jgi:hypothetical protein
LPGGALRGGFAFRGCRGPIAHHNWTLGDRGRRKSRRKNTREHGHFVSKSSLGSTGHTHSRKERLATHALVCHTNPTTHGRNGTEKRSRVRVSQRRSRGVSLLGWCDPLACATSRSQSQHSPHAGPRAERVNQPL